MKKFLVKYYWYLAGAFVVIILVINAIDNGGEKQPESVYQAEQQIANTTWIANPSDSWGLMPQHWVKLRFNVDFTCDFWTAHPCDGEWTYVGCFDYIVEEDRYENTGKRYFYAVFTYPYRSRYFSDTTDTSIKFYIVEHGITSTLRKYLYLQTYSPPTVICSKGDFNPWN